MTDESDKEEESTNSDNDNNENNSTEEYDSCEISTTTEIITNVASRVKNILVDLVDGHENSILSSDVASSSDNESIDEPVQVTPIHPNGNEKRWIHRGWVTFMDLRVFSVPQLRKVEEKRM